MQGALTALLNDVQRRDWSLAGESLKPLQAARERAAQRAERSRATTSGKLEAVSRQ